ncbi:hypothetical protein GIB67_027518 [Kingdonia uniflora]|uniref:non-specific serine/threonine protein kinase n=2 Tax=Magnoliopsida TaxID=3398 RepID=A0A7J7MFK1_9MAGN|nr:hypothetical protein GIB67_027518 [Kingdonia uniflora]
MGNCCRSPSAVAREDVKSSFSNHDNGRKEKNGRGTVAGGAEKKTITVLNGISNDGIEEKYLVDKELGRGEFGVTYLCIERDTRELLACKSISKRKLRTSVDVDDVRREVAIMKHLPKNSSIVSLKEACEDDNAVHLVMELCEGGELFDRIVARGHYTERAAAAVTRTIMEVVQLCHKHGVIHRDLKPENFLFANKKENSPLKAIDFGLSIFFKPGQKFKKEETLLIQGLHYNKGFILTAVEVPNFLHSCSVCDLCVATMIYAAAMLSQDDLEGLWDKFGWKNCEVEGYMENWIEQRFENDEGVFLWREANVVWIPNRHGSQMFLCLKGDLTSEVFPMLENSNVRKDGFQMSVGVEIDIDGLKINHHNVPMEREVSRAANFVATSAYLEDRKRSKLQEKHVITEDLAMKQVPDSRERRKAKERGTTRAKHVLIKFYLPAPASWRLQVQRIVSATVGNTMKQNELRDDVLQRPKGILASYGERFSEIVGSPYYMAPEVLKRNYGPEIDIWSAGVILYILLCGVPPFWAESEQGVAQAILRGLIDFKRDPWPNVSEGAKSLVRQMLEPDPKVRLTAKQVLEHSWLQNAKKAPNVPLGDVVKSRLKQFSVMNRFKRKALRVIADHLSNEEVDGIREMFKKIDTDNDGIVSVDELKVGLLKFGTQLAESEVQILIEAVDTYGKGTLDCGEFVAVSLHLQKMANDEHLRKAFSYFDKDDNGYIELGELQAALMEDGAADCADVANDIFQEVDTDKDGRISYDEFAAMMKTGTDWRKASRHYSRGRFNSLSIKLMKDGSINMGSEQ